ncbi:MAG: hypothetical protein M9884_17370 [Rhodocyclaceae bacterium]|nr:hypothetical protein [Rhodocyclaceae bacterium]
MAAKSRTADPESIDPEKLRETIEWMDRLSQGGFSEIASIARLVLFRMEERASYGRPDDDIYYALKAIWGKADEIRDCINSEAEMVGCAHRDERLLRLLAAQQQDPEAGAARPGGRREVAA